MHNYTIIVYKMNQPQTNKKKTNEMYIVFCAINKICKKLNKKLDFSFLNWIYLLQC